MKRGNQNYLNFKGSVMITLKASENSMKVKILTMKEIKQ